MTATDVVIVGGGPAGSTLARKLVAIGLDVVVMDKRTFPRHKPCAGWITPEVVELLDVDLDEYERERVLQPIHAFRVGVIEGAEAETHPSREPISFGIRRWELDHFLLERSGARQRLGEPLRELQREPSGWRINGDLRAPLVVGAGGHFCPVARALGASVGRQERAVVAQEIEFEMTARQAESCHVAPTVPLLLFCRDLRGYGWAFRKGGWLNVGLGRDDPERLAEQVAAFRGHLIDAGRIPGDTPTRFHGHAYRLATHAPRTVHGDGLLLIGDAAGLAHPKSGEGIRPAVESAALAAEVVISAAGTYTAARLGAYAEALRTRFGHRDVGAMKARPPGPLKCSLGRRLVATEWFARRVVQDRWFLRRDQPSLTSRARRPHRTQP